MDRGAFMHLDSIHLTNFRTFRESEITLIHPHRVFSAEELPRPKLPNVNLLLGNNGSGKTSLLKAIALAALGPAVGSAGIFPYRLIRREPTSRGRKRVQPTKATISATFRVHEQDHATVEWMDSRVLVNRKGDLEQVGWDHPDETLWEPIFSSSSDALFFVAYGANRRVEKPERFDMATRNASSFTRAQRVLSLFEETYSLIPLNAWLPKFKTHNAGRYRQVVDLVNALMGKEHYVFTGDMEGGEYLFDRGGLRVPFPALSDGYRAFLGWIGDLLYHVATTCPKGKKLVDNHGIVMVDEIDLHLHPKWQMDVLPTIAKQLPNLQFIVTSHSPLIVGSLEWMNIILMDAGKNQSTAAQRLKWSIHGLDADQVLLTDFFGLESTRAPGKRRTLKALAMQARTGDTEAAERLLEQLSSGVEAH
jgi:energy-coupling factor transporter ATP-binding protein EcfA2